MSTPAMLANPLMVHFGLRVLALPTPLGGTLGEALAESSVPLPPSAVAFLGAQPVPLDTPIGELRTGTIEIVQPAGQLG